MTMEIKEGQGGFTARSESELKLGVAMGIIPEDIEAKSQEINEAAKSILDSPDISYEEKLRTPVGYCQCNITGPGPDGKERTLVCIVKPAINPHYSRMSLLHTDGSPVEVFTASEFLAAKRMLENVAEEMKSQIAGIMGDD